VPVPSQEKLEGYVKKGILHKNCGDGRGGTPISRDRVAVHPDCWCICLCYLYFAPENPEDGEMYLLVPAHPGCPGQSSESRKMVVRVCVCLVKCYFSMSALRSGVAPYTHLTLQWQYQSLLVLQ